MTQPEMKDVEISDAIEYLHDWINGLDYDQLAELYTRHCEDADVAVRVVEPGHLDTSNWYMAGKCMQVQLIPVGEQTGGE